MKRRNILVAITSLVVLAISSPSQSAGPLVTVFKNPTCGCCGKWVEHLKANGFTVKVQEVNDTSAYERQYRDRECRIYINNATGTNRHAFRIKQRCEYRGPSVTRGGCKTISGDSRNYSVDYL